LLLLNHDHVGAVTVHFSQPVYEVNVFGSGIYVCADYGQVTASGPAGSTTVALAPTDPDDCPRGEEDGGVQLTNGTYAQFPPDFPVTSVTITVMSPLEYPRLCGNFEIPPCIGTAGAVYTVGFREPVSEQQPTLTLSCDTPVTRGDDVSCRASVAPATLSYRLVSWRAEAEGHTYDLSVQEGRAAGAVSEWKGIAVLPTHVTVVAEVQQGGSAVQLQQTTDFAVNPRSGWPNLVMPPRPTPQVDGNDTRLPYPPAFEYKGRDSVPEGSFGSTYVNFSIPRDAVGSGPNTNWWYVSAPPAVASVTIFTNRALEKGDSFYDAQKGTPPNQVFGIRYCGPTDMANLKQQVVQHENRHYDAYVDYFRTSNIQAQLEGVYMYAERALVGQPGGVSFDGLEKNWKAAEDGNAFNASAAFQKANVDDKHPVPLRCKFQYPVGKTK